MPTPISTPNRPGTRHSSGGADNRRGRPGRSGGRFSDRPKPEFDHQIVNIRRVARVMAGGRRFSFSVVVVIGDRKGRVGVGIGKASDTALAIEKAINDGKKRMIKLKLTKYGSIPHELESKYNSARIIIKPAPGRGLVVGSAVRTVFELAGIKDINAKVISRSKNKLNIARATIDALKTFSAA